MRAGKVCAVGRVGVSIIIRECRCFVIVGATRETDDALDDFGDELCVFDDEIGETDNEMVETGDAMDETGDAVGKLEDAMHEIDDAVSETGDAVSEIEAEMPANGDTVYDFDDTMRI